MATRKVEKDAINARFHKLDAKRAQRGARFDNRVIHRAVGTYPDGFHKGETPASVLRPWDAAYDRRTDPTMPPPVVKERRNGRERRP